MSRIGKSPVKIPKGVTVTVKGQTLSVKGPQGSLDFEVPAVIQFKVEGDSISFIRANDEQTVRALHGTARAMTANMLTGVSVGFTRTLDIVGVGYRAAVKGDVVDLTLGFSHPVNYKLPEGVKAEVDKDGKLHVKSASKALLGQVASDLRNFRPPEPYKGKGVRYLNEKITLKEGKARGKGK
ncbi:MULTISPECIES: 50S ribosomal protein L6 [Nannocystis]|jgi:large subunit ribosomal protein L6|uniref:Large ribosomal subunit protein uL6 n=1 Tax=Nannocystis radixulma TaxID=2995305 RepID=A0ABT5B7G6_9BACT|nr:MULTISPECIES: 50S ribosomal protein L6 [Nannocystis]MCY1056103.1 50S ribosomal protein L6 [Nannocystis sp. SCPEA4]MDC0668961.1 50S ribosomal protein L6 [Nannocystis radixulma]